ncbi:hypothetical protein [Microbacterium sp. TPD7012]|uniref:hypothetical protein n=1 Tax=Microbacterium sp. TPD7012 TaxID=2171975 RepID=UPI000D50A503|nr:hypothetical protein [Microbacterium sp. TPD7012]PVE94094.1 hypothetical protein DC434_15150 [Microbacterium sp. TPD7012]
MSSARPGWSACSARTAAGRTDLPDVEPLPGLEFTASGGRWMSRGATVVQVRSELAARVAQLAHGRSVAEVRALLT